MAKAKKGDSIVPAKDKSLVQSIRAKREAVIRKKIFVGVAREMRKAARSYHILVERCAGAKHKRGGVVECIAGSCVCKHGMYFKFTAEDAEDLFSAKIGDSS